LTESKSLYEGSRWQQVIYARAATRYARAHGARSTSRQQPPQPEPPKPKPKPIITKRQACGSFGGTDAYACHDSYVFACVDGDLRERVQAYYEGNAPDPSTQALRWARAFYGRQGDWEAATTGCQAALLDEYQRLYSGG
jgi:hypothetical protein